MNRKTERELEEWMVAVTGALLLDEDLSIKTKRVIKEAADRFLEMRKIQRTQIVENGPEVAGPDYSKTVAGEDPRIADFLRLPKTGTRLFGFSRSFWNDRIKRGEIDAVHFREPGARKGGLLLVGKSVRNFILKAKAETKQAKEADLAKVTKEQNGVTKEKSDRDIAGAKSVDWRCECCGAQAKTGLKNVKKERGKWSAQADCPYCGKGVAVSVGARGIELE